MKITKQNFNQVIKNKYSDIGGYPLIFIMEDGGTLCFDCLQENIGFVRDATLTDFLDPRWELVAVEVLWENGSDCAEDMLDGSIGFLTCDCCNRVHESAYTEQAESFEYC